MQISDISSRYSPHGNGYVKVYRKLLTSAVFQNEKLLKVWIWCLIHANWHEATCIFEGKELKLERGTFLTGRYSGSEECNMAPKTFYNQLIKLQKFGNLTLKSDNRKTLISIINYSDYQDDPSQDGQQMDTRFGENSGKIIQETSKNGQQKIDITNYDAIGYGSAIRADGHPMDTQWTPDGHLMDTDKEVKNIRSKEVYIDKKEKKKRGGYDIL